MRTLALVLGGVGAGGLAAVLAFTRPEPAGPAGRRATRFAHRSGHQRHRLAQGSPPADLLPPRHSRRPVQDPVPVLPLLGERSRPSRGFPSMQTCMGCHLVVGGSDSAQQGRDPEAADRPGTRRSRSNGSGSTSCLVTPTSRTSGTSRRWAPTPAPPATATSTRMPQVFKVNNVDNMGFCITCHIERNVSRDCTVCHY